jgi:hypothetical protein
MAADQDGSGVVVATSRWLARVMMPAVRSIP